MRRIATLLTAVVAASAIAVPAIAGPGFNNKYQETEHTFVCTDSMGNEVGEITYGGPLKMWPPNHKYQDVTITATATDPDDNVDLSTAGSHDEIIDGEELNGAGNTDNDVSPAMASDAGTGSAVTEHALRSERSGRGDGRTYTLDWDVIFTDSDADGGYVEAFCGSADLNEDGEPPVDARQDSFRVEVPHDMRGGADWKKNDSGLLATSL